MGVFWLVMGLGCQLPSLTVTDRNYSQPPESRGMERNSPISDTVKSKNMNYDNMTIIPHALLLVVRSWIGSFVRDMAEAQHRPVDLNLA